MKYNIINSENLPNSWKTSVPPRWGHSLHTLCSRTCSFPPKLAHYFICAYSKVGDKVLDSYSGKGTAPLEACLTGRIGIGNDLCPDAYVLTKAKTNVPPKKTFLEFLEKLKPRLDKADLYNIPDDVRLYFTEKTLRQIVSIREFIHSETAEKSNTAEDLCCVNFLRAMMLGVLHGRASYALSLPVPHSFAMSPSYVRKKVEENPGKYSPPERDVIECLKKKTAFVYKDPTPSVFRRGFAFMKDASEFTLDEKVDMVITSPPYFAAHTYAWDNWLRLWFIEHDYRKVAPKLLKTNSESKYLEHIGRTLGIIYELLQENSACVIIVGDVKGHEPTANLIADLVERSDEIGFRVARIITDQIAKKRKYPYGNNSYIGIIKDRILVLHKGNPSRYNPEISWSY